EAFSVLVCVPRRAQRQRWPFQCSIRVWQLSTRHRVDPTAHTLSAEGAATAARDGLTPGLGDGTRFHPWPVVLRLMVCVGPPPLRARPTAGAVGSPTGVTRAGAAPPFGLGLAMRCQCPRLQCRTRLGPGPHPQLTSPTAQARPWGATATPKRYLPNPLVAGT